MNIASALVFFVKVPKFGLKVILVQVGVELVLFGEKILARCAYRRKGVLTFTSLFLTFTAAFPYPRSSCLSNFRNWFAGENQKSPKTVLYIEKERHNVFEVDLARQKLVLE